MEDGESEALQDIKTALKSVPDAAQADYAKDLSQMLLGESQMFPGEIVQRLPSAFNWPSGKSRISREAKCRRRLSCPSCAGRSTRAIPCPPSAAKDPGLRLTVNLYYSGRFH